MVKEKPSTRRESLYKTHLISPERLLKNTHHQLCNNIDILFFSSKVTTISTSEKSIHYAEYNRREQ
ncbi:hypothetical protein SK128_027396, partial [Halocaridina rubra]